MGAHAGRGKCLEEGSTVSEKYMCTLHTYEHLTCGNMPMHLYTFVRTYVRTLHPVYTYISHVAIYWYICIHICIHMFIYDQVRMYIRTYVSCMCMYLHVCRV